MLGEPTLEHVPRLDYVIVDGDDRELPFSGLRLR
jgi:hypothetical protein